MGLALALVLSLVTAAVRTIVSVVVADQAAVMDLQDLMDQRTGKP